MTDETSGEYLYASKEECTKAGAHLTSCDDDGYCNHCGEQEVVEKPTNARGKRGPREVDGVFKMPLDLNRINMMTHAMHESLERRIKGLARWRLDSEKKSRLGAQECKVCYYIRGPVVAGQSFSSHPCKNSECDEETKHCNTDVPEYCRDCATKYGICRRCGADAELKERKSIKPPKRMPLQPSYDEVRVARLGQEIKALRKRKMPWEQFQEELTKTLAKFGVKA
jgi:hypothetical protein